MLLMNLLTYTLFFVIRTSKFYASINVKPEGGGPRAYVGHLTFQKNF